MCEREYKPSGDAEGRIGATIRDPATLMFTSPTRPVRSTAIVLRTDFERIRVRLSRVVQRHACSGWKEQLFRTTLATVLGHQCPP